jgi:hypothetical protein
MKEEKQMKFKCRQNQLAFVIFTLTCGLIFASPAQADQLKVLDSVTHSFTNRDCQANSTCALNSFYLTVENYEIDISSEGFPGWNYGTRIYASQKTASLMDIFDYGIVQFIRGCEYTSSIVGGKLQETLNIDREFYGKNVTFQHPEWVIDGVVTDPLDWNFTADPKTRFSAYQWSASGNIRSTDAKYVENAPPTSPMLFVTDHPGVVSFSPDSGIADNISLQFRTCVYRTKDVPIFVPAENINFAKALHCFDWVSSWIYDFNNKKYAHSSKIRPLCLDPNYPRPGSP